MRLSVVMRVPLAGVLSWPDSHVRLQLAFLAKEPPAEERIELAVADLMALTFNLKRSETTPARDGTDFLRFLNPWKEDAPAEMSALDAQVMSRIDAIGRRNP